MRRLLLAFQFLTIVPVKVRGEVFEKDMSGSAAFFPVVGAFQGLLAAAAALLFMRLFSSEVASGLVVFVLTLSNGGFHLDGLADTFDALAVKANGEKAFAQQKRLSVMKDSSTGAIGVIAIVFAVLLKFVFLNFLFSKYPLFSVLCLLFLMPVFSKWVMIPGMFHGISARQDGLGKIFINDTGTTTVFLSSLSVVLFCISALLFYPDRAYFQKAIALFLFLFAVLYMFSFISVKFCKERFGGTTGDNLGAISEISEILFLMVTSLWLQHSI